MTANPYAVLGVSERATDEEIRKAYLELVKKYHPDRYNDSPLKELATEKLKEVNDAYDMLTKHKSANSQGSYSDGGYSGTGSAYSGPNANEFSRVEMFINNNDLINASRVLDSISNRNARWHFLYGIVSLRQGQYDAAMQYFETAYRMEPGNIEYRKAYESVCNSRANGAYYSRYDNGGNSNSCSVCNICSTLICADCCCEAMGGDCIPCC